MGKPRVIYWFRTDLRLHDSPALKAALDLNPSVLWPIFTWDPHYVYKINANSNRWQFLLDCQNDLSESIHKVNPKSKLFVLREAPQTLFPKIFKAWGATHLVFERDTDTYARERDNVILDLAKQAGVEVITRYGRTLWDSDQVVKKNGGKPTMSITQLEAAGKKVGDIPKPIPAPSHLPDPGDMPLDFPQEPPTSLPDVNGGPPLRPGGSEDKSYTTGLAGPKGDFAVETLSELGFPEATTHHRGGESLALSRLEDIFSDTAYVATFQKPNTNPTAFDPQSTTLLSPFLHFGALSPRLLYHRTLDAIQEYDGSQGAASKPPASLTGQLLFRDMYFAAQAGIGPGFEKGDRSGENGYVRFIPWHLPTRQAGEEGRDGDDRGGGVGGGDNNRSSKNSLLSYRIDSAEADIWFRRWRAGVTGFPFVDALMRQLRAEGWIHHLGRHMLACFLTRGGCYVHWERGAEVFEELLLDHEPSCNVGNWQWLSCTAFFAQFYRCYSPVAFGKKWDKHGDLIRRYVPELAGLDDKYIYEPWKAPKAALDKAGVVIQGDGLAEGGGGEGDKKDKKKTAVYPEAMFDFNDRRSKCLAAMKRAYQIGLHGNDKQVLDGSWRKLFEEAGETEMESEGSDDEGDHADEAEHDYHKKRAAGEKQGPMDRHVKKVKT